MPVFVPAYVNPAFLNNPQQSDQPTQLPSFYPKEPIPYVFFPQKPK